MATSSGISLIIYGRTDVGLIREHNEDNFLIAELTSDVRTNEVARAIDFPVRDKGILLLVCDGMGGAAAGEVASQMAVDSITNAMAARVPKDRSELARNLRRAIEDTNDKIYAQSRDNQNERGMGTTCTAAALIDGTLIVGQIGDSRCYVMRNGKLGMITKDQSLAWQLIEAGAMTLEESKAFEHANIILQALGVQERVDVVLSQLPLRRGDILLLSSDGLHGPVSDEEIAAVLREEHDLKRAGDTLIARALEREGPDNITIVLARAEGDALPLPSPEDKVEFIPFDPGRDPGEVARLHSPQNDKETMEVPVGTALDASTTVPTSEDGLRTVKPYPPVPARPSARASQSVVAFVILTLIAALAAGLFLRFDRSKAIEAEQRSLQELERQASPLGAPQPDPAEEPALLAPQPPPSETGQTKTAEPESR